MEKQQTQKKFSRKLKAPFQLREHSKNNTKKLLLFNTETKTGLEFVTFKDEMIFVPTGQIKDSSDYSIIAPFYGVIGINRSEEGCYFLVLVTEAHCVAKMAPTRNHAGVHIFSPINCQSYNLSSYGNVAAAGERCTTKHEAKYCGHRFLFARNDAGLFVDMTAAKQKESQWPNWRFLWNRKIYENFRNTCEKHYKWLIKLIQGSINFRKNVYLIRRYACIPNRRGDTLDNSEMEVIIRGDDIKSYVVATSSYPIEHHVKNDNIILDTSAGLQNHHQQVQQFTEDYDKVEFVHLYQNYHNELKLYRLFDETRPLMCGVGDYHHYIRAGNCLTDDRVMEDTTRIDLNLVQGEKDLYSEQKQLRQRRLLVLTSFNTAASREMLDKFLASLLRIVLQSDNTELDNKSINSLVTELKRIENCLQMTDNSRQTIINKFPLLTTYLIDLLPQAKRETFLEKVNTSARSMQFYVIPYIYSDNWRSLRNQYNDLSDHILANFPENANKESDVILIITISKLMAIDSRPNFLEVLKNIIIMLSNRDYIYLTHIEDGWHSCCLVLIRSDNLSLSIGDIEGHSITKPNISALGLRMTIYQTNVALINMDLRHGSNHRPHDDLDAIMQELIFPRSRMRINDHDKVVMITSGSCPSADIQHWPPSFREYDTLVFGDQTPTKIILSKRCQNSSITRSTNDIVDIGQVKMEIQLITKEVYNEAKRTIEAMSAPSSHIIIVPMEKFSENGRKEFGKLIKNNTNNNLIVKDECEIVGNLFIVIVRDKKDTGNILEEIRRQAPDAHLPSHCQTDNNPPLPDYPHTTTPMLQQKLRWKLFCQQMNPTDFGFTIDTESSKCVTLPSQTDCTIESRITMRQHAYTSPAQLESISTTIRAEAETGGIVAATENEENSSANEDSRQNEEGSRQLSESLNLLSIGTN